MNTTPYRPARVIASMLLALNLSTLPSAPAQGGLAADILKDQTVDALSEATAQALSQRAARVALAYARDFDSLFGSYNTRLLDAQSRSRLQSWAASRSRYWGTLSVKVQAKPVSIASKYALSLGVGTLLEQAWVAQVMAQDLAELRLSAPQAAQLIPEAGWSQFTRTVAKETMAAGMDTLLQAGASWVLGKALGISFKAAGLPVTVVWALFGNADSAGGSVIEEFMPAPNDANRRALLDWSTSMLNWETTALAACRTGPPARDEISCAVLQAGTGRPNVVWPGLWSWYKLKHEYFQALGQVAQAATGAWATQYTIASDGQNDMPFRTAAAPALTGTVTPAPTQAIYEGGFLRLQGTVQGLAPTVQLVYIDPISKQSATIQAQKPPGSVAWQLQPWTLQLQLPKPGGYLYQVQARDPRSVNPVVLARGTANALPLPPKAAHPLDLPGEIRPTPSVFDQMSVAERSQTVQRYSMRGQEAATLLAQPLAGATTQRLDRISRAEPYARLANLVYDNSPGQGAWTRIADSGTADQQGFFAATYRNTAGAVVVAFRGTDDKMDLLTDLKGVFVPTRQQQLALDYAGRAMTEHGRQIILVGHSLGGGLAQLCALVHGLNAVTFNTAALNNLAALRGLAASSGAARVINLIVKGEGVNVASSLGNFGTNLGEDLVMDVDVGTWDPATLWYAGMPALKHSMSSVLYSIYAFKSLRDNYLWKPAATAAPSGALSAPPLTLLRPGQTLNLGGTFRNASGAKVIFTKPIPTESPVSTFDPVRGTWSFSKLMLSEGQYSYDVVLLGKPDTIIHKGNVDVRAMDTAGGTLTLPSPASVAVNVPWSIAGQFSGGITEIFVDLMDPTSGSTRRDRVNTLDSGGGRWSHSRSFPVAGSYSFKVIGLHPVTKAEITFGSGTVAVTAAANPPTPAPTPPGSPKVTAAQPITLLKVGQPASFNVMGDNLNAQIPLTFGACINPSIAFKDSRNMVLSCTPSLPGPQNFGWKSAPGVANVTVLRQFEVLPKDPSPAADGMRLERETFPDNTGVDGGTRIDKSWTLQNTGSSTWTPAYCLRPQPSNPVLGSAAVCVTGSVPPGQFHNFTAALQMPPAQPSATTVRQTWRLSNASGAQVGPEIWVQLQIKGTAPAPTLSIVEPFTMPSAVRAGSEAWIGAIRLNLPASQVQMVLNTPQGASSTLNWSPSGNPAQWQLSHVFPTAGIYNWTLNARGANGQVQRSGSVQVLAPVTLPNGAPTMQFNTPTRVLVGQPWELLVQTSAPAAAVRLQLGNSNGPLINLAKLSDTQFRHVQTFSSPGLVNFEVRTSFQGSPLQARPGTVQVDTATVPPAPTPPSPTPPTPPAPPVKITPLLNVPAVVQAGSPWTASLRVDEAVYSASLVFNTGRRVQFDGGPQQWVSPPAQSVFQGPGRFEYQLEIRRSMAGNSVEMFPGGVLEVRAAPVPVVTPTITSALTVEQGQPYNLTVQTSASADKVTVLWPDAATEQAFRPALDAGKTRWEFGNRLFVAVQPIPLLVRTYKDGVATPTGEARATLNISTPAAALRLLQISNQVLKGEKPIFTVAASLSVARVSVQLGSIPPQDMTAMGASGAEQNFRAQVLASQSGAVPYTITALNAQGQPVGKPLTGTVAVAEPGDSLKAANPVPAEISQGQTVQWQFLTQQAPAEMWLEFSAAHLNGGPVRLALTGAFFNHAFGFAPGDYAYRLMRRDHLGNVFAIQGAAGTLRIKPGVVAIEFSSASANGQIIREGAALRFKTGELIQLSVRTSQPAPRVFVLLKGINWDRDFTSGDKLQWSAGMAGLTKGNYPATLYLKDLNYQPLSKPTPVNFNIVVEDSQAPSAAIQSLSVSPPAVAAGQAMTFSATLTSANAAVRGAELMFPDVNVSEPMSQTGPATWARARPMTQAGANRPYRVVLTLADGQRLQQDGVYTVNAVEPPLQFNVQASPPSVKQGQTMSFSVRVSQPALLGRAELVFPDANVSEPLTQTGPDSWSRSRTMVQPGNNRPFVIRLLLRDGSSQQAGGNYSVTP